MSLNKTLEEYLGKYEKQIVALEANSGTGQITVVDMLNTASRVSFIIESLTEVRSKNQDEYEELEQRKESILKKEKCRKEALKEVDSLVEQYPTKVCYFLDIGPIDLELNHILAMRDDIEILLRGLDSYFDLTTYRIKVEALDEVFRCQYERNIEVVAEEAIEFAYFPDSFWWRHPSIVAEELDLED